MEAMKGDWVRIHNIVLEPIERAPQVPEDTRNVPLESWVKGFIQQGGKIGDEVEIITLTGRRVVGELIEIHPSYSHNYGEFVPELLEIGIQLKEILQEEGDKFE
ncbi:MAG: 2-amino-4-oxopentanoate thiolase subunit OrtA [Thermotaleaceae bacterium]